MKVLFVIIFFAAVITNELGLDLLLLQDANISLCDSSKEGQSEKENKDPVEDESKIDYFSDQGANSATSFKLYNSASFNLAALLRTPYMEVFSPPPELC